MKTSAKGVFYILAAAILWSTCGVLVKIIPFHPVALASLRSAFSILVFWVAYKKIPVKFTRINIAVALCVAFTQTIYIVANRYTTSANAIVLQYTSPIFVMLISALLFKKRPQKIEVVALAVAFAGIVVFFLDGLSAGGMLGNALALLTGVSFGGVITLSNREECDTEDAICMGQIVTFVVGAPWIFTTGITLEPLPWLMIALMGTIQLGLAYVFFNRGIQIATALDAALIAMIEPVLNPVWTLIFVGERPSVFALIGGAIVIGSITLLNSYKARRENQLTRIAP